jgi:hypothetical protein
VQHVEDHVRPDDPVLVGRGVLQVADGEPEVRVGAAGVGVRPVGDGQAALGLVPMVGGSVRFFGAPLDRELMPTVVLTVTASDGVFSAVLSYSVIVLDVNDNAPVFVVGPARQRVSLFETNTSGGFVAVGAATDADAGANAALSYRIAPPPLSRMRASSSSVKSSVGSDSHAAASSGWVPW